MAKISARTAATPPLTGKETLGLIASGLDRRTVLGMGAIVTPEHYGAIGDGVTDDTAAVQAALDSGATGVFAKNIYSITSVLSLTDQQILFGLPKSMYAVDSVGASDGRLINNISGSNKVLIKNTVSTNGNGIRDLYIDMGNNPTHTAIQFVTSYGNIVERVHIKGTMNLGILSDDAYVSSFRDVVMQGAIVKTACIFMDRCNAMLVERLHSSTAPQDSAVCNYGVAISNGHGNKITNCVFQSLTIGVATHSGSFTIDTPYFEETLCPMRLGNVNSGEGVVTVIGGNYSLPGATHPQYAKRGPVVLCSADRTVMTNPAFLVTTANTDARGPWPLLLSGANYFELHGGFHFGAVAPKLRKLFLQKNGGTTCGITIIGEDYGSHGGTALSMKRAGSFGGTMGTLYFDADSLLTTGQGWTVDTAFAAVDSLLTTDLPSGASLVL
jgi:hypothetical protein